MKKERASLEPLSSTYRDESGGGDMLLTYAKILLSNYIH